MPPLSGPTCGDLALGTLPLPASACPVCEDQALVPPLPRATSAQSCMKGLGSEGPILPLPSPIYTEPQPVESLTGQITRCWGPDLACGPRVEHL